MTMITTQPTHLRPLLFLTAIALCASSSWTGFAAKPAQTADKTGAAAAREVAFPKSVFVHNDRGGKDPFFPDRQRQDDKSSNEKALDRVKLDTLTLRGITGTADRRFALINDRTFTKGEAGEVKEGTNTFKIRVLDIKEKSVIIEREGQGGPRELPLHDNVLPISHE